MALLFYSWVIKLLINGHKMGHLAMFDWLECISEYIYIYICRCVCVDMYIHGCVEKKEKKKKEIESFKRLDISLLN